MTRFAAYSFWITLGLTALAGDDPTRTSAAVKLDQKVDIRLTTATPPAFAVIGLDPAVLDQVVRARFSDNHYAELFRVVVEPPRGSRDVPLPMIGTYSASDGTLQFAPRFRLTPGVTYRATLDAARLPASERDAPSISAKFTIPKPPSAPARVIRVDPTAASLPENLLKFYVHFSAPMTRGDVYRHFRIVTDAGKDVETPFLELDEELWNPTLTRLTLILDPGRVKRGLVPREQLGPVLEEGKSYTFLVSRTLKDSAGNALGEEFRTKFRVGPPDTVPPDPKRWTIVPPSAGSMMPLELKLDEPLDRALLEGVLRVRDAEDRPVAGKVVVLESALEWRFVPEHAWAPGEYELEIQTDLEDLAGNSIGRQFELDVFEKVDWRVKGRPQVVSLPFRVGVRNSRP
jgi:hypothetical protein